MKKGICQRCGECRYINKHHIYPRKFFTEKDNDEIAILCLDCHAEIHENLPREKQPREFYLTFTNRFIGITLVLLIISLFKMVL